MEAPLEAVLPVAIVVLLGYLTLRLELLRPTVADGLVKFVFGIAVPVLVFRTMARTEVPHGSGVVADLLLTYYLGTLLAFALGIAVAHFGFRGGPAMRSAFGAGAADGNAVLVGIAAIMLFMRKPDPVAMLLIVATHGLVMGLMTTAMRGIGRGYGGRLPGVLLTQLRHPIFLGLVAGMIYRWLDLPLTGPADAALELLGRAAIPCGLFAAGTVLARHPVLTFHPESLAVSVLKLGAHPLIVWLLATKVFALPNQWIWIAVILAAMPTAPTILTDDDGAETGGVAPAIGQSHLLAAASLTILLYLIWNR